MYKDTQHLPDASNVSGYFCVLSPTSIQDIWFIIKPFILKHKETWETWETEESLVYNAQQGLQQWLIYTESPRDYTTIKCMLISSINSHPTGYRELYINYLFGSNLYTCLKHILPIFQSITETWEVDTIVADVSPKLAKILTRVGFTEYQTRVCKVTEGLVG